MNAKRGREGETRPIQECVHCGELVYAVIGGGWAHLGRWWRPRRCRASTVATPVSDRIDAS